MSDKEKSHQDDMEQGIFNKVARLLEGAEPLFNGVQPSDGLMNAVLSAFRRKQTSSATKKKDSAELQFDSWANGVALGMRGTPQERQLLFSNTDYDLDLQIARDTTTNLHQVQGQLLHNVMTDEDLGGVELRLLPTDSWDYLERRCLTDRLGRFSFSYVEPGSYSLQVFLEEQHLALAPFDISC